jgi:squalene cyclase
MHNLCNHLSFHFPKALPRLPSKGNCVSPYTDYCIRVVYADTIVICDSETIKLAIAFLHDIQQPEGGWVGSWGICFTYATMFALESLSLVGETYETSESARRACDFLVGKQRADGGWGESYKVRCTLHKLG